MIRALLAIAVMAVIVAALYSVLSGRLDLSKPLGLIKRQAEVRGPSRRRSPQAIPPPAPRRDELPESLPDVKQVAAKLRSHQWIDEPEMPVLSAMSAHDRHGKCPECALCAADSMRLAQVALDAVVEHLDHMERRTQQLPIAGVPQAITREEVQR